MVKCPTCERTFEAPVTLSLAVPSPVAAPQPEVAVPPETAGDEPPGSLEANQPPRQPDYLSPCPRCGEYVEEGATRCRFCGENLQGHKDEATQEEERLRERFGQFGERRDAEPHRGTLILVLGNISLVLLPLCGPLGLPFGIAAWVMGRRDLAKIRQNLMDRDGEGTTQAGWICGIIGTILDSLALLGCLAYFALVFTMLAAVRQVPAPPPRPVPVQPAPIPPAGPRGEKDGAAL
jgi:hypothetical protein